MTLKNTVKSYGSIAKWLHLTTVGLFLASYVAVYYRHWFTDEKTPENWTDLQLYLSIGVTIGVIVVLRILWKVINQNPEFEPGTRLEHLAAKYSTKSVSDCQSRYEPKAITHSPAAAV